MVADSPDLVIAKRLLDHVKVRPDTVADSVSRYLKHMNLAYAGLDFVITPDDRWVLLEANSGPQFEWLEAATGAPMVDAMAELLMKGNM